MQHSSRFDDSNEADFDRVTRVAARALGAPVAQFNIITATQQIAVSSVGEEPWQGRRAVGLEASYCQHVVRTGEPLLIDDARAHPLVRDNRATTEAGIAAYAAVPVVLRDGVVAGSLCVVDFEPREWTTADRGVLEDLAASLVAKIELGQLAALLELRVQDGVAELSLANSGRLLVEEQFRQSHKMQAVGQLAGGVAHDFNNLLTVITSYCGMLLSELPGDDEHRSDVIQIAEAARRAAGLTRQLLAFSRQQVLEPRIVDVNALIGHMEELLRRLIREDIAMVVTLEATDATAWADPGQLEQVLMNLVVNARDAMPNGGTLTIRTSNGASTTGSGGGTRLVMPDDDCVTIEVRDTGTGMTPAVLARIFDPFFTTKDVGQGTGLGLSTVYGIIQQSGGDILVNSEPGAGTTFRIHLPCRGADGDRAEAPGHRPAQARAAGEKVLVVEDDAAVRSAAVRILRKQGYDVLESDDPRRALALCTQEPRIAIDLVLTDMVMPEMSGFELGQQISAARPDVRMLYMSGYTQDWLGRDGVAERSVTYIEKPFTPELLASKVREVLDARQRPQRVALSA